MTSIDWALLKKNMKAASAVICFKHRLLPTVKLNEWKQAARSFDALQATWVQP
jgi:hypothetical protein